MSQKNDDSGLYIYAPMILIAAFLLGCLSISLVEVREGAGKYIYHQTVSQSDSSENNRSRKSSVRENGGLKYRVVSTSDSVRNSENYVVDTWVNAGVSSQVTVSSDDNSSSETFSRAEQPVSSEEPVSSVDEPVSSVDEAVSSEDENVKKLTLPNEHYINFIPPKEGRVAYLTFDDGPSSNTEEILDILDYYNVKATFFVIYHKDMQDKYKEIVERGHTIGLHSYTHDYAKIYRSQNAFFNDITRISDYVYSVTGVRSKIIRFPGGSSNTVSRHYSKDIMKTLTASASQKGYYYHDWNVDSGDAAANNLAPEKMLENIKKSLTKYRKPDVLMHDGGASHRTTVEALPEIIEYIYSQGYKMEGLKPESYAVHHAS